MKKAVAAIFLIFSALAAVAALAGEPGGDMTKAKAAKLTDDTPVLRINGRPVAKIWYDRILADYSSQHSMKGAKNSEGGSDFSNMAMESLVEKELLYEKAVKAGAPDGKEEIDRRVKVIIDKMGGAEGFLKWQKEAGLNEEQLRYLLRRELTSDWYVKKYMDEEIKVSKEDIAKFYKSEKAKYYSFPEKRKIYQILASEARGEEAAKKRLEEVVEKYNSKKAGFAELAREYSDEPTSRLNEGYIGERAKDELPEEVGEATFKAVPGELTPIVHSKWGYHVLLVTAIAPPSTVSIEEATPDIVNRIKELRAKKAIKNDLKKYGKEHKIEILMHY